MRIEGSNPTFQIDSEPGAREVMPIRAPGTASATTDHVDIHQRPVVSPTNVLVEMQPGNIVVYKFIDASGQLIQQIPSEQMLNLATTDETSKESKK
jgi:hypothetical protein